MKRKLAVLVATAALMMGVNLPQAVAADRWVDIPGAAHSCPSQYDVHVRVDLKTVGPSYTADSVSVYLNSPDAGMDQQRFRSNFYISSSYYRTVADFDTNVPFFRWSSTGSFLRIVDPMANIGNPAVNVWVYCGY